jgi:hypothetical protein
VVGYPIKRRAQSRSDWRRGGRRWRHRGRDRVQLLSITTLSVPFLLSTPHSCDRPFQSDQEQERCEQRGREREEETFRFEWMRISCCHGRSGKNCRFGSTTTVNAREQRVPGPVMVLLYQQWIAE